jgi:hypothetical protein
MRELLDDLIDQVMIDEGPEGLRRVILELTGAYARTAHAPKPFDRDTSPVPVSGKVYGEADMRSLVDSSLDFWLTTGRFNDQFEARLADYIGVKHALTTNSGSSANLLALSTLTSHYLRDRALVPGDEVITVATGFPTTAAIWPRARVRRCRHPDLQCPLRQDRGGGIGPHPGDYDCAHARQSLRSWRGDARRREA